MTCRRSIRPLSSRWPFWTSSVSGRAQGGALQRAEAVTRKLADGCTRYLRSPVVEVTLFASTATPPCGSMSDVARASCHCRELAGSCWSSVETLP